MSEQQHIYQPLQHERQSNTARPILLLLLLLVLSVFAYTALRLGNDGGQTGTDGQCLSNGTQFNGRQEAFALAQMAEQYRAGHPYNGNYGYASYTLCNKDGTQQRTPSPVAPGFDNITDPTQPRNDTHSEQALHRWLLNQLAGISFSPKMLAGIYVIIFS